MPLDDQEPEDETYFNDNMDDAPDEGPVLLALPDDDAPDGYAIEYGYWDAAEKRWTGEFRHVTEDDGTTPAVIASAEPFAWAEVPDLDSALIEKHITKKAA